jgi:hypothetical protein
VRVKVLVKDQVKIPDCCRPLTPSPLPAGAIRGDTAREPYPSDVRTSPATGLQTLDERNLLPLIAARAARMPLTGVTKRDD